MLTVRRFLGWLSLTVVLCASACSSPSSTQAEKDAPLQVFAAASLSGAFEELGGRFEAETGETVSFNFAGSQVLANQILEGAPADIFASANMRQMERLVSAGEVANDQVSIFAHNQLVVAVSKSGASRVQALPDLARSGLRVVLGAREVPAGQYALDFLDKASGDPAFGVQYREQVLQNVVSYEENVKIILTRLSFGEADAGIVYRSDVSGSAGAGLTVIEIPESLNVTADYPIAPLSGSQRARAAQAFIDFIRTEEGQSILADHGFIAAR